MLLMYDCTPYVYLVLSVLCMFGLSFFVFFFFFKQKTAYEMRISDWSSDVCSSDLQGQIRIEDDSLTHMPNRNGVLVPANDRHIRRVRGKIGMVDRKSVV